MKLMDLYSKVNNPLERLFLLSLYRKKFSFDLPRYLGNLNLIKNDNNITKFFIEIEEKAREVPKVDFEN